MSSPSKQSLLQKINESIRYPINESRTTPINPGGDMLIRVKGSANSSCRENATANGDFPVAAPSTPPSPYSVNRSTTSSVSLPPLTPKRNRALIIASEMRDQFTTREIDLLNEVNAFRRSPSAYAQKMALLMEIHEPFVSHKRMTYPELLQFVSDRSDEKGSLERTLEEMGAKERDEKQGLQTKWSAEDVERAKKNKKTALAAANKKRGSAVGEEIDYVALERNGILQEIAQRYESARTQATTALQRVSGELHRAAHGAKFIGICLKKLAASPELQELAYGRGLSLAARDASAIGEGAIIQVGELARRYGSGVAYSIAQFAGEESAEQTVMEILLSRNDTGFCGRKALLDPTFDSVGCGWRSNGSGTTFTTFILSSKFEELQAITCRHHLPLTQLKHELPNAVKETPGTAIGIYSNMGIEVIAPRNHPMPCGNLARMVFRCPDGLQLCGVVTHVDDAEPQGPTQGDGRSFAHRLDEGTIELLSVLPHRGDFAVTLFASNASFSSGYSRIGRVLIASYDWKPLDSPTLLPISSGDFAKRNCRLVSPMSGIIPPLTSQTFDVVVPFSTYLKDELSVIESELASIGGRYQRSGDSIDDLEAAAEAAKLHLAEVEIQCNKQIQALDEGIQNLVKEAVRKRGKETKTKNVQAELEEQRRAEEQQIAIATQAVVEANARVDAYRRSARQVLAQQKRLNSERENLRAAMDRNKPLHVEISVGDRRAIVPALADTNTTRYGLTLRVPKEGRVCLYINGLLQLTWKIGDN